MRERVVKLFATFRETSLHNTEKTITLLLCKRYLWANIDTQNGRIHFRCWIERTGWYTRDDAWLSIKLYAHRQQTQISGHSYNTLRYLQLYHDHKQAWRILALKKMSKGRCRDIVRQIGY